MQFFSPQIRLSTISSTFFRAVNLTEWGKSVKVAPNEVQFASTWLWPSFSYLWRAYKIIVEIHTQQNSPHGFTVFSLIFQGSNFNLLVQPLVVKSIGTTAERGEGHPT